MPICITGMHRSGTSMVAHLLTFCGLYLGPKAEMLSPTPANPSGYWELKSIMRLNDDILAAWGGSWDHPPISLPDNLGQDSVTADLSCRAQTIISQLAKQSPWGWKDPRNSITLPFWQSLLQDIKVVVCLRTPLDSIQSTANRGDPVAEGYKTWDIYYKHLKSCLKDLPFIVTHYDSYFEDASAELQRLIDFLNLSTDEKTIVAACQIIKEQLRRHHTTTVELIESEVPPETVAHYFEWCQQAGPIYQKYREAEKKIRPLKHFDLDYPDTNEILSARLSLAQEQLSEAQKQLTDREQQLQTLSTELSQFEKTVQTQVSELSRLRQEVDVSRIKLASIYQTRSWQLISNWWQFKARYMPSDSAQLRTYYLLRTSAGTVAKGGWKSFFERTRLWLQGERRYYQPDTKSAGAKPDSSHLSNASPTSFGPPDAFGNVIQQRFEEAFGAGQTEFVIHPVTDPTYAAYICEAEPHLDELRRQVKQAQTWPDPPAFSIITVIMTQPRQGMEETIASLQTQTYPHWACFLIDAGNDESVRQKLTDYATKDARFKTVRAGDAPILTTAINQTLEQSVGDYIIFVKAGDTLAPHTLYSLASQLRDKPDIDLIYADVDRLDEQGRRGKPLFKPNRWSPELLLSANYLGRLGAFRRSLLEQTGYLNPELEEAFEWDLSLRLSEVTERIYHLPQVLYHQRAELEPAADLNQSRPQQLTAISNHLSRTGAVSPTVTINETQNIVVRWQSARPKRISIIIPSKDNPGYLERCLNSIFELTAYPDFEVLVVDNNSVLPETHRLYQRFENDSRFRLVPFNEPFNFSRACNVGVQQAEGSLLLFLNNDTEVLQGDWLELMAQWFDRAGVGVVGPKLLFDDGKIQHAGVVLGFGWSCSHIFMGNYENTPTMYGSDTWYRNYLAVTGACLMVSRQALEQVKGWNEAYQMMFSDVDLCLEIYRAGYRIVYTPDVRLKHYAHSTNADRFPRNDYVLVAERWVGYLTEGDPYFNPNLSVAGDVALPTFKLGKEEPTLNRLQALLDRTAGMQFIKHKRVMVVSGDVLPLEGLPTTGAGLRAWGIGQGLRARGFEVLFAMTKETADSVNYQSSRNDVLIFDPRQFQEIVYQLRPDVLIFQHWPLARLLHQPYPHTVIDLHGPLMLENLFRIGEECRDLYRQKLEAFSLADYFTCAGERQRNYFYAWLSITGLDLRENPIEVVPFSLSPELPSHEYPDDLTFVYGGVFLPWQNPILGLRVLLEELEANKTGHLNFYGGKHPWVKMSGQEFERVRQLLLSSSRATVMPTVSRDKLIQRYKNSSVAWDLMSHNTERGMAVTSRTVEYLWTGLPVVYNNYAELAQYIEQYEAGWTVNPDDELAIRKVVQEIIQNPGEIKRRGENAQRLATEVLNWEKAVEPLDRFISNPHRARRLFESPVLVDPTIR